MKNSLADDLLAETVGIQMYLQNTAFASHTVDLVSGGSANFTYRIHLREPVDGKPTFILKYAPPYVAASAKTTRMEFSPERQKFEAEALRLARNMAKSDDTIVTVPAVRLLDETAHVMIIDDAGADACTLKELLIGGGLSASLLEEIGTALGRFISDVHHWHELSHVDLTPFANNEIGKTISSFVTYGRLVSTLTGKDKIPALADPLLKVSEERLEVISDLADRRCREIHSSTAFDVLTHGDFWPGNIMVVLERGADGSAEGLKRLYVLDWEVARTGLPGLDLGQFCAELHLVSRFHPHQAQAAATVIDAFLSAYKKSHAAGAELARIVVGHIGAHLVAWTPRVAWGGREQTREVVQEGVELLELGAQVDSSLKGSIVEPLLDP